MSCAEPPGEGHPGGTTQAGPDPRQGVMAGRCSRRGQRVHCVDTRPERDHRPTGSHDASLPAFGRPLSLTLG